MPGGLAVRSCRRGYLNKAMALLVDAATTTVGEPVKAAWRPTAAPATDSHLQPPACLVLFCPTLLHNDQSQGQGRQRGQGRGMLQQRTPSAADLGAAECTAGGAAYTSDGGPVLIRSVRCGLSHAQSPRRAAGGGLVAAAQ